MYKIKNSKELASLINCINLNNMISEEEMEEYLDKVGELNFNSITISPTYVSLAKEKLAIKKGKDEIAIISGIGTRNYYRKFGYERKGPYMAKKLI